MTLEEYLEYRLEEIRKEMGFHLVEMDDNPEFKDYHYKEYLINYYVLHELENIIDVMTTGKVQSKEDEINE